MVRLVPRTQVQIDREALLAKRAVDCLWFARVLDPLAVGAVAPFREEAASRFRGAEVRVLGNYVRDGLIFMLIVGDDVLRFAEQIRPVFNEVARLAINGASRNSASARVLCAVVADDQAGDLESTALLGGSWDSLRVHNRFCVLLRPLPDAANRPDGAQGSA